MTYQQPWETGYAPKAAPPEPDSRISEIDPQNPFENTLENPEYRMDYRRTLPQILLPGYQIPLFPERDERKAIRKSFNTAGFWIFMSCVLEQVLFLVLMLVIFLCMGVSPGQYLFGLSDKAQAYFQNSSLLIALNGLLFSVLNTSIALIGCRRMRIAPRSLFQTKDLRAGTAIRYIITGISLQCVAGLAYTALESIFSVSDQLAEADFSYFQSGKSIIATMLYTCILAPVTEELLYRGFLMKTLSRVGCRFAIIVSALMFGMAHGNISQMMLGVLVGLFLGKIDMRHKSLLPSILVHMGINTTSRILNLLQYYSDSSLGTLLLGLSGMFYYAIALLGIIFWFWKERKQPLPYPTQKQCTRNRIFWSSPWLLTAFGLLIILTIYNQLAA